MQSKLYYILEALEVIRGNNQSKGLSTLWGFDFPIQKIHQKVKREASLKTSSF